MLNNEDIKKLTDVFATREEIVTKEELNSLRQDFINLQTAVDNYAKRAEAFFQEMTMLAHKVDRHEQWIHKIAEKLGVKLEY